MEADAAAVTAAAPVTERAPAAGGEHAVASHRLSLASAYAEEEAAEKALELTLGSLSPETILKVWEREGLQHPCTRHVSPYIVCHCLSRAPMPARLKAPEELLGDLLWINPSPECLPYPRFPETCLLLN